MCTHVFFHLFYLFSQLSGPNVQRLFGNPVQLTIWWSCSFDMPTSSALSFCLKLQFALITPSTFSWWAVSNEERGLPKRFWSRRIVFLWSSPLKILIHMQTMQSEIHVSPLTVVIPSSFSYECLQRNISQLPKIWLQRAASLKDHWKSSLSHKHGYPTTFCVSLHYEYNWRHTNMFF